MRFMGTMTILLWTIGAGSVAWADLTDTDARLRTLEEKIEALQKKNLLASQTTAGLSLTDKVISADANDDTLQVRYKYPGFEMRTQDELFSTKLVWRAQMRYTNPNRSDPRSLADFTTREGVSNFELRRIRMKIGGHGYKKWIKYYFEIDLQPSRDYDDTSINSAPRVIDYRLTVQPIDEIGIRLGQWKINYNRERVDSSGRQTMVDRSIVNRIFTIDRQVGVMVQGRLFKESLADMRYYAGVFNGEGRSVNNDSGEHMYMGRLQWNFLGRDLKWRQSDIERHQKPAGNLAFAYANNNGRCTRWSSSGCGNLSAFTAPASATAAQFRIDQWMQEFAFKYQGLAIQQEYHRKEVEDKSTGLTHELEGLVAQVGYFFNELIPQVPEGLELAVRYAFLEEPYSAADNLNTNKREEYTVGLNYFMAGHNNKVTLDYSYLTLDDFASGREVSDNRIRLQWDISF